MLECVNSAVAGRTLSRGTFSMDHYQRDKRRNGNAAAAASDGAVAAMGPVEQTMLAITDSKARIVGILSPDQLTKTSPLSAQLAECYAKSGVHTLLIELAENGAADDDDGSGNWAPGDELSNYIVDCTAGFDRLAARPSETTRPLFNNLDKLRRMMKSDLSAYDTIVVDLGAVLHAGQDSTPNPVAVARACDAVIMLCTTGETKHSDVRNAVTALGTAGVQIGGAVLDDHHSPTLGVEIANSLRRLAARLPIGASWLASLAQRSTFLNTRY